MLGFGLALALLARAFAFKLALMVGELFVDESRLATWTKSEVA